jgi:hypothetical protein
VNPLVKLEYPATIQLCFPAINQPYQYVDWNKDLIEYLLNFVLVVLCHFVSEKYRKAGLKSILLSEEGQLCRVIFQYMDFSCRSMIKGFSFADKFQSILMTGNKEFSKNV